MLASFLVVGDSTEGISGLFLLSFIVRDNRVGLPVRDVGVLFSLEIFGTLVAFPSVSNLVLELIFKELDVVGSRNVNNNKAEGNEESEDRFHLFYKNKL